MIFKVYNLFTINKAQKTQDPAALRCFLRSAARQRRTICKREKLGGYMRNGKGWKSEFALQQLAQQVQLHESQNRHQKRQHHRQAIEANAEPTSEKSGRKACKLGIPAAEAAAPPEAGDFEPAIAAEPWTKGFKPREIIALGEL